MKVQKPFQEYQKVEEHGADTPTDRQIQARRIRNDLINEKELRYRIQNSKYVLVVTKK